MNYSFQQYIEIPDSLLKNSEIYRNRSAMLSCLPISKNGDAAEIGVAMGDFSRVIIDIIRPLKFYAIDFFAMHNEESHWGTPSTALFKGMSHEDFYRDRFKENVVTIMKGLSHEMIPKLPDLGLDLIYIDAGHSYDDVRVDAELSLGKLRSGGIMIFNDYTLYDQYLGVPYGVIRAANEFIVKNNLEVLGLSLEQNMFCDLAVRKA